MLTRAVDLLNEVATQKITGEVVSLLIQICTDFQPILKELKRFSLLNL